MSSLTSIANRALQKLGAGRITDLNENSKAARECKAALPDVLEAELRDHPWNCATKRVSLAADSETPAFGRENQFTLPADCVKPLPPDPESNSPYRDWIVEGGKILTNDSAPLELRYTAYTEDANLMDALLRETIAARLAMELCESLTQSNTKKADVAMDYDRSVKRARRANAFENVAVQPPEDPWVSVRL